MKFEDILFTKYINFPIYELKEMGLLPIDYDLDKQKGTEGGMN